MKANETPEKIYLNPMQDALTEMLSTIVKGDIEYTRTDAFIEKATSYIQQHWIWNTKMIEDFKNYMKGE